MSTDLEQEPIALWIRSQLASDESVGLYAVVDACQAPELIELARSQYGQPNRMLFKGKAASLEEVELFAPFFISIDPETDFLDHWITYCGENAGVLFTTAAPPVRIFRHLRKIFVVQDEGGQEHFFRFYDPRVLRVYLPTCSREELRTFFGPIQAFYVDGKEPSKLVKFGIESEDLQTVNV
jgi:hypothetical protein